MRTCRVRGRSSPRARAAWEADDAGRPSSATATTRRSSPGACSTRRGASAGSRYKTGQGHPGWVVRMFDEVKQKLDPSRLVEDNSPCSVRPRQDGHQLVALLHRRLPPGPRAHRGHGGAHAKPGSPKNYVPGRTQGNEPLINSEYGGVSVAAAATATSRGVSAISPRCCASTNDPGLRLHRAERHRVGAQRLCRTTTGRPRSSATTPSCRA